MDDEGNVVGHSAVDVSDVVVVPVVIDVAQTTVSEHVEEAQADVVELSPKFVTEQST